MKSVKAKLQETKPEAVEAFEKNAAAFAKKIVTNFKDYEFYTGESMNPDGMVALLNYREDGTTPCKFTGWACADLQTSLSGATVSRLSRSRLCCLVVLIFTCYAIVIVGGNEGGVDG